MPDNFSAIEYSLYGRQMILPELGVEGQRKLKSSHVVVVGAGALGTPVLLYLAGAGVGTITVIDDDIVEVSNLHRQVIHHYSRVNNSKVESAADSMRSLNPFIEVRAVQQRLTAENATELFANANVVIDGSDNFETRYIVSAECARLGIPHVWAAILGFDAQMSVFWAGRGPVYEDLYPVQPPAGTVPTCSTAGVIGVLPGVVGTAMAMEVVKALTGIGTLLMGEVGYYSGLEGRWEYIPLFAQFKREKVSEGYSGENSKGQTESKLINGHNHIKLVKSTSGTARKELNWSEFEELKEQESVYLIDVREPAEFLAIAVPGAVNLPFVVLQEMQENGLLGKYISANFGGGKSPIGFYCSGGPRSDVAAEIFRDHGVTQAYNIRGGLADWLNRKISLN